MIGRFRGTEGTGGSTSADLGSGSSPSVLRAGVPHLPTAPTKINVCTMCYYAAPKLFFSPLKKKKKKKKIKIISEMNLEEVCRSSAARKAVIGKREEQH